MIDQSPKWTAMVRYLVAVVALVPFVTWAGTELVMDDGVSIEASMNGSSIKINAGTGFERSYEWGGCRLKSHMGARKQRWFGSMGIYDPAPSFGLSLGGCDGLSRTVVQEGQIHFDDMQFAYEWIRRQQRAYAKTVWTNDGLLVSWNAVPARTQLNVDVWLMCINGERPNGMSGATDSAVKVFPNRSGHGIYSCAAVSKEVISQTRNQLENEWKMVDEWIARDKKRQQEISR